MLKKSKTTILWLSLGLLAISQIGLMAKNYEKTKPEGTDLVTEITTKLTNNSKKYSVWLTTRYESMYQGVPALTSINPLGYKWVPKNGGEGSGTTSNNAPSGKAWLYYTDVKDPGMSTGSGVAPLEFDLPEGNNKFSVGPFNVDIKARPVSVEYEDSDLGGFKYWKFYEYTITISDKS